MTFSFFFNKPIVEMDFNVFQHDMKNDTKAKMAMAQKPKWQSNGYTLQMHAYAFKCERKYNNNKPRTLEKWVVELVVAVLTVKTTKKD